MSIASDIAARLLDPTLVPEDGVLPFRVVGLATDLAALKGIPPKTLPAAYVFLAAEEADENHRATGPVLQGVNVDIAITIITSNFSDGRGAAASGDIEMLKAEVRRRLLGFTPASAEAPLELEGGEVTSFAAGVVWWEERFSTHFLIEEASHD